MKVCTDACILGAWIADKIESGQISASSILDIGAGTGLLSLMLAQKSSAKIDAIEIEKNTFTEAVENFNQSLWYDCLQAFHMDVKNFTPAEKYDFIICNPPFYEDDLLSPIQNKNVAKHDKALSLNELISVIKNLINSSGSFAVLLPYHRSVYFKTLVNNQTFFLKEELLIRPTLQHRYFRAILLFNRTKDTSVKKELIIKNESGNYSKEFVELLKEYYINL